jgi:hypothetical protein
VFMLASASWATLFLTGTLQMGHAGRDSDHPWCGGVIGTPASQLIIHDMVPHESCRAPSVSTRAPDLAILLGPAEVEV